MDEVDGRPGHVALQFGHFDAPMDVPMVSLCLPHSAPSFTVILSKDRTIQIVILSESAAADESKDLHFRSSHTQIRTTQELHHENLPGK